MAWNEPGNGQDPWGGGGRNNGDGPPDLDQVWRRLRDRLSKGGGKGGRGSSGGGGGGLNPRHLLWLIPIAVVIWLLSGMYVVQPGEKGVLLRFGKYMQTVESGWHWYWPAPVGRVIGVDTQQVRSASTRGIVLTKDESLAEIQVSLQYRVKDPMQYLFVLSSPDHTVEQVLKSALREMVGTSRLNQVIQKGVSPEELSSEAVEKVDLKESSDEENHNNPLSSLPEDIREQVHRQMVAYPDIQSRSRALLPQNIHEIIQTTLDHYNAGIIVTAVNVQYAQPPEAVQSAFEKAIKAREAKERKKNLARAYARKILARAEGQKANILADAKAYKARKVAKAKGESVRYTKLRKQYDKAPDVTRERLYLETMDQVLGSARLILADKGDNGPMLYLPLQQLEKESSNKAADDSSAKTSDTTSDQSGSSDNTASSQSDQDNDVDRLRSRGRNP